MVVHLPDERAGRIGLQRKGADMNDTHRPTVAIVEDDGTMSYLLDEICKSAGCEVIGRVASAGAALELLGETVPDYLILDFKLDGQRNGLDLLQVAKQGNPDLFSIMITAWDINDIASRMDHFQPDRILRKPVTPHVLIALLEATTAARCGAGGAARQCPDPLQPRPN